MGWCYDLENRVMKIDHSLSLLPEKLEEFYCMSSIMHGKIELRDLPRNLRMLVLTRENGERAYVDVANLPPNLQLVSNYALIGKSEFHFSDKAKPTKSRIIGEITFSCSKANLFKIDKLCPTYRRLSNQWDSNRSLVPIP